MGSKTHSSNQPVLLAVLAHPDDETFGMGGTLALYARRGVKVHLVCATRGEAGEIDPEFFNGLTTKAEVRETELRCASGLLGLSGVHFLDYRDSGMVGSPDNQHPDALLNAPVDKVAADITRLIRKLRPDVVITFDPIGGYRHPDHIAIHYATVKAFYAAANPQEYPDGLPAHQPQRLFFHTFPHNFLRFAVRLMPLFRVNPRQFGRNKDINLLDIVSVRFPIHAVIRYHEVAEIRDKATACHASQGGLQFFKGPLGWLRRVFSSQETFMQAYPEPQYRRPINDLFAGIVQYENGVKPQKTVVQKE
jgi:LmbE family N-acetylglucosaminyl deacetylase